MLNPDYKAAQGLLTFAPGETTKKISIEVLGDNAYEVNETMNLNLFQATGATIADNLGIGTIVSTDSAGTSGLYTPILNSKIDAANTIYLDFDGQLISGTSWNDRYNAGAPFTVTPFSNDSDYTRFSASELAAIEAVWSRVSEDYRPFNVNVTTDAAVYAATATNNRLTAVITESSSWYPQVAGGVATINILAYPGMIIINPPGFLLIIYPIV